MSNASIAAATGIPITFVGAIRSVESGGDPSAVRFEPHVFWRTRKGLPSSATGAQIRAALSPAELAQVPYTPGETTWRAANGLPPCRISRAASCTSSETNEAAMERAMAVSAAPAMRATSYGSFQVLGGDLLALYGSDPTRALAAFRAAPDPVSDALLVHFLTVTKPAALQAAIDGDVATFVHLYNGCTDCTAYITKFQAALRSGGAGGALVLLLAAAAGAWWWSR